MKWTCLTTAILLSLFVIGSARADAPRCYPEPGGGLLCVNPYNGARWHVPAAPVVPGVGAYVQEAPRPPLPPLGPCPVNRYTLGAALAFLQSQPGSLPGALGASQYAEVYAQSWNCTH